MFIIYCVVTSYSSITCNTNINIPKLIMKNANGLGHLSKAKGV